MAVEKGEDRLELGNGIFGDVHEGRLVAQRAGGAALSLVRAVLGRVVYSLAMAFLIGRRRRRRVGAEVVIRKGLRRVALEVGAGGRGRRR